MGSWLAGTWISNHKNFLQDAVPSDPALKDGAMGTSLLEKVGSGERAGKEGTGRRNGQTNRAPKTEQ